MDRTELLQQVEDLTALLAAIDRLVPGHVSPELFAYLDHLPKCHVSADLLLAALKQQKAAAPPTERLPRHRAV